MLKQHFTILKLTLAALSTIHNIHLADKPRNIPLIKQLKLDKTKIIQPNITTSHPLSNEPDLHTADQEKYQHHTEWWINKIWHFNS